MDQQTAGLETPGQHKNLALVPGNHAQPLKRRNAMSSTSELVGAWSEFNFTIHSEAKKVFDKAVALYGAKYTALAVATQVVNGTNYCFLCEGQLVIPEQPQFAALVYVYKPLKGEPHITGIKRINP
jgi:hypothetical protein